MTKLEELTVLLVNEINDFKNDIEKLEKINDHLENTKIKIDLVEYKFLIETHQQKIVAHINSLERFESRLENILKNSKIYPNWAVILLLVSVLLGIVSLVYTYISIGLSN
ncbi:DUF6730 family protein [Algibacter sp. 2305UL17-15]|uniref:DUF6730 family protein n=1 Tax=Algibacter sp. 2305UL17-15 TaxID=3231268 RepID=UPI003458FC0C